MASNLQGVVAIVDGRRTAHKADSPSARLHTAGWSAGDFARAAGWWVLGVNGENVVLVTGPSQAEA